MSQKEKLDWRKWVMRIILILVSCSSIIGGCTAINKKLGLGDDHIAEEIGEWVLKDQTGLDYDFTPDSKER